VWWIEGTGVCKANNLLACMGFETGLRFSSDVKNPHSSATGLIQFMNATAVGLGTTTADLAAMSELKQLGFVYKYFQAVVKARGPLRDLPDTYMAILNPKGIGQSLDYNMWVKGSSQYAVNAGLDANEDHIITKAEAAARVTTLLAQGLQPENMG
jgi:hypothetical protein